MLAAEAPWQVPLISDVSFLQQLRQQKQLGTVGQFLLAKEVKSSSGSAKHTTDHNIGLKDLLLSSDDSDGLSIENTLPNARSGTAKSPRLEPLTATMTHGDELAMWDAARQNVAKSNSYGNLLLPSGGSSRLVYQGESGTSVGGARSDCQMPSSSRCPKYDFPDSSSKEPVTTPPSQPQPPPQQRQKPAVLLMQLLSRHDEDDDSAITNTGPTAAVATTTTVDKTPGGSDSKFEGLLSTPSGSDCSTMGREGSNNSMESDRNNSEAETPRNNLLRVGVDSVKLLPILCKSLD